MGAKSREAGDECLADECASRQRRPTSLVLAATPCAVVPFPRPTPAPSSVLLELHDAMGEEARADLLAYARGRLRRDRA